jgi:serine phosphatase RsbU (regulator of sigma subunit)
MLHPEDGENALKVEGMGDALGTHAGVGLRAEGDSAPEGQQRLFYCNGLVEAHDPKGEMFGFPRLRALVAEHGEQRSLEETLLEELYSFVGEGWGQEDDITLLSLRRSAP